VDYGNNQVVLMDPYGIDKDLLSVMEVRNILKSANWTVRLRKMSCQQLGDGNSCGYHVLQWIWQMANLRNLEAESWVPADYDASQWITKVQKDFGFADRGEIQRKKTARRGPARYRRWKREQYRLKHDKNMDQEPEGKLGLKESVPKLKMSDNRRVSKAKKTMLFYSNNMNGGLARPEKLRQIVKWINDKQPTAILLQETHMTLQEEKRGWVQKILDTEAPGYRIYSAGTEDEKVKGVAVIVSRALVPFVKKDQIIMDEAARYIAVPCRTLVNGQVLWLFSIYAPVNEREKKGFYKKDLKSLSDRMLKLANPNDMVIIGMDANAVRDPIQDVEWEKYQKVDHVQLQ